MSRHRNRWLRKFGVLIAQYQITKDLNVPDCARVGQENQRITGDHFVIPLYVNGKLLMGKEIGTDISLANRKIVGSVIISYIRA